MQEGYSLYEDKRGYNTIFLPYKCANFERGGPYYPNTLNEVRGDGIELPFSDYCQNLNNADCNILRVKWNGRGASDSNGWLSIEPPPYGTYNIWQTALDPDTLATYRSEQVTYPVGAAAWAASNLKEFIDQCAAYNVYLHVILFEASEFLSGWPYHAWNASNYYINGNACEVADRGFLANAYEFYTDATAIQAAKDRIDFITDVLGTNTAVVSWELFAEMTWCMTPDFWDEAAWGPTMISNIRTKISPWVATMANYLRAADPYNRPIAMGLLRPPASGDWPADPDSYSNVINEPMVQYPVDICCINMYDDAFSDCVREFRMAKQYTDKMIWATQFSPIQMDPAPAEEPSPFLESKKRLWIGICGERWGLTPLRWPGLRESSDNVWATGGYADADLYSIPSITKTFAANVGWNANWKTYNYVYDDYVVASGTSEMISYGDGENVTFFAEWSSGGTKSITIKNLASAGVHSLYYYDWTDGSLAGTMNATAAGGSCSFSISVSSYEDNMLVAHLLKP